MSLQVLTSAIGGLGNIFAQYKAGKVAQQGRREYIGEMEGMLSGQRQDIASILESDAFRNYLQTDQAQSFLRTTQDQLRENADMLRGGIAKSGGTSEAQVAGQTAMNKGFADTINRLAAHGTMYNSQARARLMAALQGLAGQKQQFAEGKFNIRNQQAQGWSTAGQQFGSSMTDLGASMDDSVGSILKLIGV